MSYQQHATITKTELSNQLVIFTHPIVSASKGDLVLSVNPYNITWSYGLNTANFSTYGGEVVQILSMYFEDMTIEGDVRAYHDIEEIHKWFLFYMQVATQGNQGIGSYDARPVNFSYPHRGWQFDIYPKELPSFKYGRDVVTPSYTINAAVHEVDPVLKDLIVDEAQIKAYGGGDIDTFGKATAGIGFKEDNPFSGPTNQTFKGPGSVQDSNKGSGDFFTSLIPAWMNGDFKDLLGLGSKPPDLGQSKPTTGSGSGSGSGPGAQTTTGRRTSGT